MAEASCSGSLEGLFDIVARVCAGAPVPDRLRLIPGEAAFSGGQGDLFGGGTPDAQPKTRYGEGGALFGINAGGAGIAEEFFQASVNGYTHFIHGWMSELPIEAELIRFAARIISQARRSGQPGSEAARNAAGQVLSDREDKAVSAVLAAAYKVAREIDRMRKSKKEQ